MEGFHERVLKKIDLFFSVMNRLYKSYNMNRILRIPTKQRITMGRKIESMKILVTCLESDTIQDMIRRGEKETIWNIMKMMFVFEQPNDLLLHSANIVGYTFSKEASMEEHIQEIFKEMMLFYRSDLEKKIMTEPCLEKKIDIIADYANGYVTEPFRRKKITYKYDDSVSHLQIVDKILDILDETSLKEQVNRERSLHWKSALVWNFVKFNYSFDANKGQRLNEDVEQMIKSFIPYSVRVDQLRIKYNNQYLFDGLMKKKQIILKTIIEKLNRGYKGLYYPRIIINVTRKKCEQTKGIIDYFTKLEDFSKGDTVKLNDGSNVRLIKGTKNREKYCKKLYNSLLLFVTIINTPNHKKINVKPTEQK